MWKVCKVTKAAAVWTFLAMFNAGVAFLNIAIIENPNNHLLGFFNGIIAFFCLLRAIDEVY